MFCYPTAPSIIIFNTPTLQAIHISNLPQNTHFCPEKAKIHQPLAQPSADGDMEFIMVNLCN